MYFTQRERKNIEFNISIGDLLYFLRDFFEGRYESYRGLVNDDMEEIDHEEIDYSGVDEERL